MEVEDLVKEFQKKMLSNGKTDVGRQSVKVSANCQLSFLSANCQLSIIPLKTGFTFACR